MGKRLAAWIDTDSSGNQYRSCLGKIVGVYGTLDNFESILADLMTCPSGSKAATFGVERHYLLLDLTEAIRDYFDTIRSAPAPLYDGLTRLLRPGDTVITFNYDLGIERALRSAGLWSIKSGYGFLIENDEQPSSVELLKLHGSTNWRGIYFGGRTTGAFVVNRNSLGDRPVLYFRSDLDYLGYQDFVDPLCSGVKTAANSPAMILPALPKTFWSETSFGKEWKPFWDHLWCRAESAIEKADELVIIGYSLPAVDQRARHTLLCTTNKAVRLTICCHESSTGIEQEFRGQAFSSIATGTSTFEGFLSAETARSDGGAGTPTLQERVYDCSMDTLARLNSLIGTRGLLKIANHGEVGFTFLSVDPAPNLPAESDFEAFHNAISLSSFRVCFDDGVLIDDSDTKVISGYYISRLF
jgi:hypothetical protein